MQLNDLDVFKECAKSPKYTYFIENSQVVKVLYKVWSGYTKFIRAQITQGRSVMSPELGRFMVRDGLVKFIPSSRFLDLNRLVYAGANSIEARDHKDKSKDQHVSYSAIAHVCGQERTLVYNAVKEILHRAVKSKQVSLAAQGKTVKLGVKVGYVMIIGTRVEFM
jgi:hypothetical protein